MQRRPVWSAALLLALTAGTAVAQDRGAQPPYRDPSLPVARRVEDLLSRMTLEEKVAQMLCLWNGKRPITDAQGRFDPSHAPEWFRVGIGRIERPSDGHGARAEAEFTNAIQRWVKEHTRLGIPVIFHEEALHGLHGDRRRPASRRRSRWRARGTRTWWSAPSPWSRARSRARGAQQVLAPVVDMARDPRWGRIEETYGEDPYLSSADGPGGGARLPGRRPRRSRPAT